MILRYYEHKDKEQVVNQVVKNTYLQKYLNKGFPWIVLAILGIQKNQFMVLEENGQIVAAGCIRRKFQEIWLYGIEVRKDMRGKGFGKELMLQLLTYVEQHYKQKSVRLTVARDNMVAVNLYKKLGFQMMGEKNEYFTMQYNYAKI